MPDFERMKPYLPSPPSPNEKYQYFGRSRRWVFFWLLVSTAGVLYGYLHVAAKAWAISPLMWLLLTVMVPPTVVNFWLRIGKPRLTLADHLAKVSCYQPAGETVDVFLPSCGESLEVLDNTFKHVKGLIWQGAMTVYVLDDSARESVRRPPHGNGVPFGVRAN